MEHFNLDAWNQGTKDMADVDEKVHRDIYSW